MKTVLITGASSGIGAALAEHAGQRGWRVIVGFGDGRERAKEICARIKAHGGDATPLQLPLSDNTKLKSAMKTLSAITRQVETAVLCASPAPKLLSFLKTTSADLHEQFQVNVVASQSLLVQLWKQYFEPQQHGHVVAVLSAALVPPPWAHMSSYVVAKYGLRHLLDVALVELGPAGLRATAVYPDYTDTPMLQACHPMVLEAALAKRPQGRFLRPSEVAERIYSCMESPPKDERLEELIVRLPNP